MVIATRPGGCYRDLMITTRLGDCYIDLVTDMETL